MREPSLSLAVNDVRLVLQLYWQSTNAVQRENEVRTRALKYGAEGYINTGERVPSLFGFSYGEVPSKNSYSAAYSLAREYNKSLCVCAVDFYYRKQQYFWVCGVKDGAVVIDGDKITTDEGHARKLFISLKEHLETIHNNEREILLHCPDEWSVPNSTVKQLQEIEVIPEARIIRTQTLWERYRTPLITVALCLAVAYGANFAWTEYQAYTKKRAEEARRAKKEAESAQNKAKEEKERLERIRRSKAWLKAPTPVQFIARCLDDHNRILLVPGWKIADFNCAKTGEAESASVVRYQREPSGERRLLRLAYREIQDARLVMLVNSNDATVTFQSAPYPPLERRMDLNPLKRIDVESYLADAFEPFGGSVEFTDRSDTTGQSERMVTEDGSLIGVYRFQVSTVLQPDQFVGLLNRIPTLLVISMQSQPLTDNHWRIEGQVYFQE